MQSLVLTAGVVCLALATTVSAAHELPPVFGNEDKARTAPDTRVRSYLTATRVVWTSDTSGTHVKNAQRLLIPGTGQAELVNRSPSVLKSDARHTAAVLLDFGREINGSVQLVTGMWENKKPLRARIRFGESVTEAMTDTGTAANATNDHAIRDQTVSLPWLGEIEVGDSGFRFVRIDLLDTEEQLLLKDVRAVFTYRDLPYLGSFRSSDERLNQIWMTGAYTVQLNMQGYLWDGVKRDRLVWVGDLHPEVMTIASVFGDNEVVPRSLDQARDAAPLPEYMNGISSYSMWWIILHRDWYLHRGNIAYLREQRTYLRGLLEQLMSRVQGGREALDGWRFLDWSTEGKPGAVDAGLQALLVMSLEAGAELSVLLEDESTAARCRATAARLKRHIPGTEGSKQATALQALAGMVDVHRANELLSVQGAAGFSTFYGYYILQAKALAGDYDGALANIRDYWGGMLDLGATSFWEDFDLAWLDNAARIDELVPVGKVDVHASYGRHVYKGLRMSLAHGWASGPTAWLTQHVLGVHVLEPGARVIRIEPNLADLSFVEGTFPTPHGIVEIKHTRDPAGKIRSTVKAPDGVRIVMGEQARSH
jgi:alpha-L-rhamnosidase